MDKSKVRRADLVFSLCLMIMAVYFFVKSAALFINPFGREFEKINAEELKIGLMEWYKSPGLLPMVLSIIIFILAVILWNVARRDGAAFDFLTRSNLTIFLKNRELKVAVIVVGYLLIYIYGMIPVCRRHLNLFPRFQGFPFMIATFGYLALFMITFNKKSVKAILTSILIAVLAAGAITYGFGNLALIPLP